MKRTIVLGSIVLSAGLTLTQASFSVNKNSSQLSIHPLTAEFELIVYDATNEDGDREQVKTKPKT